MTILEIIATISTILCVWLTGKNNILCWLLGIISALSLIGAYSHTDMYAQILLQSIFLIQSIIGWYNWGTKDTLKVSSISYGDLFFQLCLVIIGGYIFSIRDVFLNNSFPDKLAYFDGISASVALLANWFLTKKIIQAWPLFIAYNLFLSVVLFSQGIYLLVVLNIFLAYISTNSFIKWRRDLQTV